MISHYESGSKELSAERFLEIGQAMGYSRRRLEASRFGLGVSLRELAGDAEDGAGEPADGTREAEVRSESEALSRRLAAEMAGLAASRTIDRALQSAHLRRRARRERAQAEELCRRLLKLPFAQQGIWIAEDPAFQSWAVIERLGEMSATVASSSPARARQLAGWAQQAAEASPETPDKARRVGYAAFFVGNALRVNQRLREAHAAFEVGWRMWAEGERVGGPPFTRWRPYDLEASLRRDQELWAEAVRLADRALSLAPERARARILINKASCLQLGGLQAQAVPVIAEAAARIDPEREPRLALGAHFIFAACLFETEKLDQAEEHLAKARILGSTLESEVDLARCDWLGARLAAKRKQRDLALGGFARARNTFATHDLALDCASVSLHESIFLLEAGESSRARQIAGAVAWTLTSEGIVQEGRDALAVYFQAARREEATAELARWASARLKSRPSGS